MIVAEALAASAVVGRIIECIGNAIPDVNRSRAFYRVVSGYFMSFDIQTRYQQSSPRSLHFIGKNAGRILCDNRPGAQSVLFDILIRVSCRRKSSFNTVIYWHLEFPPLINSGDVGITDTESKTAAYSSLSVAENRTTNEQNDRPTTRHQTRGTAQSPATTATVVALSCLVPGPGYIQLLLLEH